MGLIWAAQTRLRGAKVRIWGVIRPQGGLRSQEGYNQPNLYHNYGW